MAGSINEDVSCVGRVCPLQVEIPIMIAESLQMVRRRPTLLRSRPEATHGGFGRLHRAALVAAFLIASAAVLQPAHAAGGDPIRFKRIATQYIAALGEPGASAGVGAQSWGLWPLDPGPRGVELGRYGTLIKAGNVAPAGWTFDGAAWWLEEHGLIMEPPEFPAPARKYVVTGGRDVTAVLTIHAPDAKGERRWELDHGATLYDVTHLACRSARYEPASGTSGACTPARARQAAFPVAPGAEMPPVEGCRKQDYAVLIVIGVVQDK